MEWNQSPRLARLTGLPAHRSQHLSDQKNADVAERAQEAAPFPRRSVVLERRMPGAPWIPASLEMALTLQGYYHRTVALFHTPLCLLVDGAQLAQGARQHLTHAALRLFEQFSDGD